jgi:hypothetical protein
MQKIIIIISLALVVASCRTKQMVTKEPVIVGQPVDTVVPIQPVAIGTDEYSPHTLIIYYDGEVGAAPLLEAAKRMGCEIIYQYNNFQGVALRVPDKIKIEDAIGVFKKEKGVTQVNRDRIMHLD